MDVGECVPKLSQEGRWVVLRQENAEIKLGMLLLVAGILESLLGS